MVTSASALAKVLVSPSSSAQVNVRSPHVIAGSDGRVDAEWRIRLVGEARSHHAPVFQVVTEHEPRSVVLEQSTIAMACATKTRRRTEP